MKNTPKKEGVVIKKHIKYLKIPQKIGGIF